MEKTVLNVNGMTCEHCVRAVKTAVGALPGVTDVLVDLTAKKVTVEYDTNKSPLSDIQAAIEEEGYEVA